MPRAERYEYKYRLPQRRRRRWGWLLVPLVLLVLAVYPFVEARQLSLDEHPVAIANLPMNLKNTRIVYLTDLHTDGDPAGSISALFTRVNNLSPDIIILGGDYAADSDGALEFFRRAPALHARLGVYVVLGDCDRSGPAENLNLLTALIEGCGYTPLVNRVERVRIGTAYLCIAGADDLLNGTPDIQGIASQVSTDDIVLFVGHNPDLMQEMLNARSKDGSNHWFDVALFGHTLGGQIRLGNLTPFRSHIPAAGVRYLHGWLEESRATVLVSSGIGTPGLPIRAGAVPEYHLITLKVK